MSLFAPDPGKDVTYDPVPQDLHHAICYGVYDLGTTLQEMRISGKQVSKDVHKVLIVWELPQQRLDFERDEEPVNLPRSISKRYTLSLHKKSHLRKDMESWRGKAFTDDELATFDFQTLLGVNCTVQVIHNISGDKVYANVATVLPLVDQSQKHESENKHKFYSFTGSTNIPEGTPDWIIDKIKSAKEWGSGSLEETEYSKGNPPLNDDSIPF